MLLWELLLLAGRRMAAAAVTPLDRCGLQRGWRRESEEANARVATVHVRCSSMVVVWQVGGV
jgi:hypothetical protein